LYYRLCLLEEPEASGAGVEREALERVFRDAVEREKLVETPAENGCYTLSLENTDEEEATTFGYLMGYAVLHVRGIAT